MVKVVAAKLVDAGYMAVSNAERWKRVTILKRRNRGSRVTRVKR
jgi:hypothetical protein